MSALDVLGTMDAATQRAYDDALPRARNLSVKLPLVRVTPAVSRPDERIDFFRHGRLKPAHKSRNATDLETRLRASDSLYFHGGRTKEDYGRAALVLRGDFGSAEATPFGLGSLLCSETKPEHRDPAIWEPGHCAAPIAHDAESDQATFLRHSLWATDWRQRAAQYFAAYYQDRPENYFASDANGRPLLADPEGIYHHPATVDWRCWTIEVRLKEEVNLFEILSQDRLLYWALDSELEETLTPAADYPFLARLRRETSLRVVGSTFENSLEEIDRRVRQEVLK